MKRARRPVLIVSPDAFNQITGVPVVRPVTSGGNFAGIKTTGVVRCDQPPPISVRAGKKLESVPAAIMDEVLTNWPRFSREQAPNRRSNQGAGFVRPASAGRETMVGENAIGAAVLGGIGGDM